MKSLSTIILSIAISTQLYSQELSKDAFIGTWKVIDSRTMPEMEMELDAEGQMMMEQMREGFIGTIFNFKDNNEFTVKFSANGSLVMKELSFINNKNWKISKDQKIAIGTEKDNYTLMFINVLIKQGKKYFVIDETPFILEVIEL